jgi:hypothetical protein
MQVQNINFEFDYDFEIDIHQYALHLLFKRVKNSIEDIQGRMDARAKLHLDNLTRWISAFLLMNSFQKA